MTIRRLGLLAGPGLFLLIQLFVPESAMPAAAKSVAAVTAMMALLWMTEALPIAVTALLPVVLFPLLGVTGMQDVTANYAHHLVFLFLGGFWIAAAMQRSDAHRRIALLVLRIAGSRMERVILGFMAATAFLSMWLSNTATTMMMLPIALAVIGRHGESGTGFSRSLLLGIAYSASIGGVATLIGTPPNAVLAGVAEKMLGISIPFWKWMLLGLPLSLAMFVLCWWYLTRVLAPLRGLHLGEESAGLLREELASLGPLRRQEARVLLVFALVAVLWVFKGLVPLQWVRQLDDSTIAIAGALALFMIPSGGAARGRLLDWQTAVEIPWEVLILFGGGFALAQGFQLSGLTEWIGNRLDFLPGTHWLVFVVLIALVTIFLTEVTSNTATASMLLPIVAGLAGASGDPFYPMVATALAASFAFMLPVATPPNAIIFASRKISIPEMVRAGIWMNLAGVVLITLAVLFLLPLVWG
ncbi:MAG: DASS family sodium-coupled anion symporter [Gammaproteobacteria bacterium]